MKSKSFGAGVHGVRPVGVQYVVTSIPSAQPQPLPASDALRHCAAPHLSSCRAT